MRRTVGMILILLCMGGLGAGTALAATGYGFGFGGGMAMAFFPDLTEIDSFLAANGLDPMGGTLIGGGGGGRGGVIGGLTFGGVGWGVVATSEGEGRHAELVFGGGGFDVGWAIGGDENSVLTVGTVLGGGADVLTLTDVSYGPVGDAARGLIPEPTQWELGCAVGFVQPYVSMAARLLPWMGFELRLGYVLPVFSIPFGDLAATGPSLALSGPTVSLGLVFGGIGSAESGDRTSRKMEDVTQTSSGGFPIAEGVELVVENQVGDIVISPYVVEATQTASAQWVEWQAVRTAREDQIESLQVQFEAVESGMALRTVGTGRVDYTLRVPAGTNLSIKNGIGAISIASHQAPTVIVENGVGDVSVERVSAAALIVAAGVGNVDLRAIDAAALIVDLGIGDISLSLPATTSARMTAKAGFGDVAIERFPGMTGGVRGFLGKTGDVTLGAGADSVELHVTFGGIDVTIEAP